MISSINFSHAAEKGFFISLLLYSFALPVSMAATNFALALLVFFAFLLFWQEGRASDHSAKQHSSEASGVLKNNKERDGEKIDRGSGIQKNKPRIRERKNGVTISAVK